MVGFALVLADLETLASEGLLAAELAPFNSSVAAASVAVSVAFNGDTSGASTGAAPPGAAAVGVVEGVEVTGVAGVVTPGGSVGSGFAVA